MKNRTVLAVMLGACLCLFFLPRPPKMPATDKAVRYSVWVRMVEQKSKHAKSFKWEFPPSLDMGWKETNFQRSTLTLSVTIPGAEWHFRGKTAEERALIQQHTLLKAALDHFEDENDHKYTNGPFDCVVVLLWDQNLIKKVPSKDGVSSSYVFPDEADSAAILAKAVYSPDGGGVSGSEEPANRNYEVIWPPFKQESDPGRPVGTPTPPSVDHQSFKRSP